MRAKTTTDDQMSSAVEFNEKARPFAAALVERELRRTGSRMAAYEGVASMVGVSSAWLRRLIGRQSGFVLAAHQYHNLAHAYSRLCERMERDVEQDRQRAAVLRRVANEVLESLDKPLAGTSRAPGGGEEVS